jgi:hypothetical protein
MEDEEEFAPTPESDDDFNSSLEGASLDFDSSLKAKFTEPQYKKLRTIGAFIMRGLTLDESCILSRVSPSNLKALMADNEDVANFIHFKQTAYKAGLLNTVTASAIAGKNFKSAGYLLEKKYPKEFDPKKDDPDAREPDVIEKAIRFVQASGDTKPIVKALPPRTT